MLFKTFYTNKTLDESFRGASHLSNDNQIVLLPKAGWVTPYSLTYSEYPIIDKKVYKLGDELPLEDWLLSPEYKEKLDTVLNNVSMRLSNLGLPTQNQHVAFMDFKKNEEKLKNKGIRPDLYWVGAHIPYKNTILIDKTLFLRDSLDSVENAITHEVAHFLWEQLTKEQKQWFINWYNFNVLQPVVKSYVSNENKLGDKSIDMIFNKFDREKTGNIQKDIDIIFPKIIKDIKTGIDDKSVKHIKDSVKSQLKRDKTILSDYDKFMEIMKRIKLPQQSYKDLNLADSEAEKLRNFAKEKGLTPSEYAASSPMELWAEAIEYASKNLKSISRELKYAILGTLTGTQS